MISSKRPIVVYIEQARIPDETTSITRSEVPITGDIVVHHRIQNGANNKAMGDGFLKELYDVLNGAVGENLRFEDGASVFVYTSCARSIENYENFERNIRFGSDLPVHSFRACQKIFNLCKENHYDLHIGNGKVLVVIATYGATGDESINDAANEEVTALLSSAAPANDGASLLLDNVPADFDGRTLSLTNERVLVKDGDSEVVFAPASYNADDIQFTDTKQTLSGFTVARSDYADSDSSKTYLVEGTDHNFLAVTNNEDLLNSILQVQ